MYAAPNGDAPGRGSSRRGAGRQPARLRVGGQRQDARPVGAAQRQDQAIERLVRIGRLEDMQVGDGEFGQRRGRTVMGDRVQPARMAGAGHAPGGARQFDRGRRLGHRQDAAVQRHAEQTGGCSLVQTRPVERAGGKGGDVGRRQERGLAQRQCRQLRQDRREAGQGGDELGGCGVRRLERRVGLAGLLPAEGKVAGERVLERLAVSMAAQALEPGASSGGTAGIGWRVR